MKLIANGKIRTYNAMTPFGLKFCCAVTWETAETISLGNQASKTTENLEIQDEVNCTQMDNNRPGQKDPSVNRDPCDALA